MTEISCDLKKSFFDESFCRLQKGTEMVLGKVDKRGVVLRGDVPGEMDRTIENFCSPIIKMEDGSLRLYYSVIKEYRTKTNEFGIAVALSSDGKNWEKPNLGQIKIGDFDTNRIKINGIPEGCFCVQPSIIRLSKNQWRMYCWVHGQGYVRYVASDSSDGLEWRVIDLENACVYHPGDKKMPAMRGAEGLTLDKVDGFKEDPAMREQSKKLISNDATFTYFDEEKKKYEMYSVWLIPNSEDSGRYVQHDNAPGILRTIHRRKSTDGLSWGEPELLIVPDENDPLDLQFYHLAVQRVNKWRIGFLGHYRCQTQTMDIELAFSRDGRYWERPVRCPWPLRDKNAIDSIMVYPPQNLVKTESGWQLFYTGCNHHHNAYLTGEKQESAILLAEIKGDRFLGIRAKKKGEILTSPFIPTKENIILDADISGSLAAQLCDTFGKPLPGYTFQDFLPIRGDSTAHVLRWENAKTTHFMYDALSLRLQWNNGDIFSIVF